MVHGLRLRGGRAEWYRNRYVVSDGIASALGRPGIPGPRNGWGDNTANTNVLDMGGRTYALVEAGALPVELTYTLETVARSNLEGSLSHGFSAHPKFDPTTGEMHVMAYQPGLFALSYIVVGADGRARTVAEIPAPHCPMIHDVAFTRRFAVVLDLPVTFNFEAFATGMPFAWDPERTPRLGLLPRTGDLAGLRWIETPSCYVFHVMNAFEEDELVVLDVVRHPKMFDRNRNGPNEGLPLLARWTIDLTTGRLSETIFDDRGVEFPRFNDAFGGLPYRYGYTTSAGQGDSAGPIYKVDHRQARLEVHDFGKGRTGFEPVFVPKAGAREEDEGYILAFVHDASRNGADVVIIDAQAFDQPPLAVISLPVRVPFGFHGNFLADPR
jgi:carotenoid cleavage dioxygenase